MDLRSVQDIEHLRQIALVQKTQIDQLLRVLSRKCQELEALKCDPGELQRTLDLLNTLRRKAESEATRETPTASEKKERQRKPGHGPSAQPDLPRSTETYVLEESDQLCSSCGGTLTAWEGQLERSEMVDVVDVEYRLIEVQRQKYVCRCGGCVKTAPGPERAIPGGRYSVAFAAKVVVDKYLDHLPLERQVRIMRRHGLTVTSQALWDQVWQVSQWMRPNWEALREKLFVQSVIGLDQTSWPNLEKKKAKAWQMWCLTGDRLVYHHIRGDKGADTFVELLQGYTGAVVCDALATHEAGARGSPGVTLVGCWAHVRRYFGDAEPDHPEARIALDLIRDLYDIDERAVDAEERAKLRDTESRAVTERLRAWLLAQPILKTTSLGQAVRYTLGCWPRLVRFLDDSRLWLDNNPTERALRGPVVGRRNHFGSKSRRGTEAAAILYSLIETAKLCGVDPAAYLAEACLRAQRTPGAVLLPGDLQTG